MSKVSLTFSVIIANWNGKYLLQKNLANVLSIFAHEEIILVDDASTDGSTLFVKNNFPRITIVTKDKHEGFASTINYGVARAQGDIVILLNSDVRPTTNMLSILRKDFDNSNLFAVGFLDRSHEKGTIVTRGRGQAMWDKGFFIHWRGQSDKRDTAWVSAGSGAFRKKIWNILGGMDSLYNPFYWEDIDLSYRALKSGYAILFEPTCIVDHYHEEGMILHNYSENSINQIAYRNQFYFIWKNLTDPLFICAHIIWIPIRLIQSFIRGDSAMIVGFLSAFMHLPKVLKSRIRSIRFQKKSDRDLFITDKTSHPPA